MVVAELSGEPAVSSPRALCHYRSHQHGKLLKFFPCVSELHYCGDSVDLMYVFSQHRFCSFGNRRWVDVCFSLCPDLLNIVDMLFNLAYSVEANDAVIVAGMTRPKQFPNEHLSDLAVSMATKLQCFQSIGKYFKQSAKALEEKIAREARFYGALIRY
ncbi:hypothetical protein ACS0TY_022185 [Phlomoides rotata]